MGREGQTSARAIPVETQAAPLSRVREFFGGRVHAGGQRTSPALLAPLLQSWQLLWPVLAPSDWPRDHSLWGETFLPHWVLGIWGSRGLNKEMLFLVLTKFNKNRLQS